MGSVKDGSLAERLRRIESIVLDVDGVLTDGSITYSGDGPELKSFSVKDGFALKLWRQSGGRLFVITGRKSPAVERRCMELGVEELVQGAETKADALNKLMHDRGLERRTLAAVGDDWPDLPLLLGCAVGATVADAHEGIRSAADLVTRAPGGRGAVAEFVELVLRANGGWERATAEYRRPA
jgi:3-deoxy-D-manno-octulosonate 8-phosphate phosphatase (KDO 8-P phosphatase)